MIIVYSYSKKEDDTKNVNSETSLFVDVNNPLSYNTNGVQSPRKGKLLSIQLIIKSLSEPRKKGKFSFKNSIHELKQQILNPRQRLMSDYDSPVLRYIDNFFRISTLESSISNEIIGGVTMFLVTACTTLQ